MAWIEFHPSKLKKLQKFSDLRRMLQWNVNETLGFLGSFWGEVIDLREDGDITGWNSAYICDLTGIGIDPERVWDALVACRWIDVVPERVLVHDWLDTAGKFLAKKYSSSNKERLIEIWALHGKRYGSDPQADEKRTERVPTFPFPSFPNQPERLTANESPKNGDSSPPVSASPPKNNDKDAPTPEKLVDFWNRSVHVNIPRVVKLTETRKRHVKARLAEYPDKNFWVGLIERINKSRFLRGEATPHLNGKSWRADFDWVMNPTNLTKIIEGNYDGR